MLRTLRSARYPMPLGLLTGLISLWIAGLPVCPPRDAAAQAVEPSAAMDQEALDLFERTIRPTLVNHCFTCHAAGAEQIEGGLRVDSREGLRLGGESGPAVVPGAASESPLLDALEYGDRQMPPDQKLPADVIADFRRWIEMGAADPREVPVDATTSVAPAKRESRDWQQAREFWAFRPPRSATLPQVTQHRWPRRRHDYFVLEQMEQAGLTPNPPASQGVLSRRVGYDLIGLPLNAILADGESLDAAEFAYEELVDRLMDSPQFGERWARLWLDLARYAEDQAHIVGDDKSLFYPNAYLFRDWLIRAFNEDLSYDEFVRRQIAADCDSRNDPRELAALGFIGLGPKYYDRGRLEVKAEEWEDRVDTVCRTFLGLTVACARCHDHKYDPIPTEDYYALASVFASTEMFNRPLDEEGIELKNGQAKNPEQAMHVVREGDPTDLQVFVRGKVDSPGPPSHRGFLTVLSEQERITFEQGSGRRELAEAIASPANPLTARVFVNRVWGELLGHPLVTTPSNFGTLGDRPSHPRVLDDLAVRFMEHDWSVKWLVREIVTSATYCQSSLCSPAQAELDPENRLLSRMDRKRLSIEAWRDSMLWANRRLATDVGGPSIDPGDPESRRRTLYSSVSRFELHPMLAVFDFPDANVHAPRRTQTTTPLQKLFALNHPFVIRQASAMAERVQVGDETSIADAVCQLYQNVLGRSPSPAEADLACQFVSTAPDSHAAWTQLSHALFASNEFMFLD